MPDVIKPSPSMEAAGLKCFKDALTRSKCYLEYGCGGSTVYAGNVALVPCIISVESDNAWALKTKASVNAPNVRVYLEHCDIGEVGDWGSPKNMSKVGNFWNYPITPWRIAKREGLAPDTVLIDGRFRVASFLFSLLAAAEGTRILFDDYLDRPHYFVAEEFCPIAEKHGRMAVFVTTKNFSITDICERIAQYSVVPA